MLGLMLQPPASAGVLRAAGERESGQAAGVDIFGVYGMEGHIGRHRRREQSQGSRVCRCQAQLAVEDRGPLSVQAQCADQLPEGSLEQLSMER